MFKKLCELLFGKPYVAEHHVADVTSEPVAPAPVSAMETAKPKKPRKAAVKKKPAKTKSK